MVTLDNHYHYIGMHCWGSIADDSSVAGKVPKKLKRDCDTPEKALGAVITELRLKLGWNTADVAAKVDCNIGYLNEIENGIRNPAFKLLKAIADLHQIKLSQLLARAERRHENCPKKKKS